MKFVLICPSKRPSVRLLAEAQPLCIVPLLGQSLLEYWLSHLASEGTREVLVLAEDRVEQVRRLAGNGERWGLSLQVHAEPIEPTSAQALLKHGGSSNGSSQTAVALLDHFPTQANRPLFTSYADWFSGLLSWIPYARTQDGVGMRERQPGIWVGAHSRISKSAHLRPPCWLGQNVFVGTGAIVGPNAVVEDGAFIEPGAEIVHSSVRPETFVGRWTRLSNSLAWGNTLLDLQSASITEVPDAFLLCSLGKPQAAEAENWAGKHSVLSATEEDEAHWLLKQLLIDRES